MKRNIIGIPTDHENIFIDIMNVLDVDKIIIGTIDGVDYIIDNNNVYKVDINGDYLEALPKDFNTREIIKRKVYLRNLDNNPNYKSMAYSVYRKSVNLFNNETTFRDMMQQILKDKKCSISCDLITKINYTLTLQGIVISSSKFKLGIDKLVLIYSIQPNGNIMFNVVDDSNSYIAIIYNKEECNLKLDDLKKKDKQILEGICQRIVSTYLLTNYQS